MTTSIVTPQQADSLRGHYAGFVTRAIAFFIDLLLVVISQLLLLLSLRFLLGFFGFNELSEAVFQAAETEPSTALIFLTRWGLALTSSSLVFAIYAIFMWVLVDKTLGQALLGLRILRTDGSPVTFGNAIRRLIGYYLSAVPLFLGFLWVLVDDRRQGWHDKLAGTVVVYDWDARLGRRLRQWMAERNDQGQQMTLMDQMEAIDDVLAEDTLYIDKTDTPEIIQSPTGRQGDQG